MTDASYLLTARMRVRPQLEVPRTQSAPLIQDERAVGAVVMAYAVDVVHRLRRQQRAAERLLNSYTVLEHAAPHAIDGH
ncbi:hypothetical protein V1460_17765 [Streptomyces sp. SCSIO 30461]|uniref:hypothetical protein n=1 Tax=Streptomyces sp. SCSIO 30461 TaxID=3118085 RepID=UPI0030CE24EA